MSNYSHILYAKVLFELISNEKDSSKMKRNIANFLDFLVKKGDTKKIGKIIDVTENLFYKKTGKRKITLEFARKTGQNNILKDFFQEGDVVQEKVNPELIAGIKVIVNNEKQLDFSLKNKLDNIFT